MALTGLVVREDEWKIVTELVLDGISSPHTRRAYSQALEEFLIWFRDEPNRQFNKATVVIPVLATGAASGSSVASGIEGAQLVVASGSTEGDGSTGSDTCLWTAPTGEADGVSPEMDSDTQRIFSAEGNTHTRYARFGRGSRHLCAPALDRRAPWGEPRACTGILARGCVRRLRRRRQCPIREHRALRCRIGRRSGGSGRAACFTRPASAPRSRRPTQAVRRIMGQG